MHEAFEQAKDTTPPSLRLVGGSDGFSGDEITQITEIDERPEDTLVQERDRIGEVVTRTNPSPEELQAAFEGIAYQIGGWSAEYKVTGNALGDSNGGVYKLFITPSDSFTTADSTIVNIGISPEDGSPTWKIEGPKINDEYKGDLIALVETVIDDARRA